VCECWQNARGGQVFFEFQFFQRLPVQLASLGEVVKSPLIPTRTDKSLVFPSIRDLTFSIPGDKICAMNADEKRFFVSPGESRRRSPLIRITRTVGLLPLLLLLTPPVAQAQFNYTTNEGTITITKYTGFAGAVTVPGTINGLPVTRIGIAAFSFSSSVTSVAIPNSVTSIGDWAFWYCSSVTSVAIPNSVTSIGEGAFHGCPSLTNIVIPDSVSNIGAGAFAFCPGLTSITIPESVDGIGDWAFWYCTGLTNVTIPNSVTDIGEGAFWHCAGLTSITIPGSVTSIGGAAFASCSKLTSITIPDSVTYIGYGAFGNCSSLAAITVAALNPFYCSVAGVLFDKNQTVLIQYPKGNSESYTIPDSVTSIGGEAFAGSGLSSVTIPNSVTNIGQSAFYGCPNLTSITIPNGVTSVGYGTFAYCSGLTSALIPSGVTSIGGEAFAGSGLVTVTIPASVTSIGEGAFRACNSLAGVHFKGNAPHDGSDVFYSTPNPTVYYLPGSTGWGATYGGRPTAPWKPLAQIGQGRLGERTNEFGFAIDWASGRVIVVEVCTSLTNPNWSPLQTNTLTADSVYFSDPQWTNYPARFYRLRSQ